MPCNNKAEKGKLEKKENPENGNRQVEKEEATGVSLATAKAKRKQSGESATSFLRSRRLIVSAALGYCPPPPTNSNSSTNFVFIHWRKIRARFELVMFFIVIC